MDLTVQPEQMRTMFRHNLRVRRKQLGLTQEALAERAGLKQATIAQFESGVAVPAFDTIALLAEALDTLPDALLRADIFSKTRLD